MKRFLLVLASGLVCGGLYQSTLYAQYPGPTNPYIQRPTVSPYVNLLRRGQDPAALYYGSVRPQLDFYKFRQQQSAINQQLQAGAAQLTQPEEGATGHTSYFQQYSHFYPSITSARQGSRTSQQQQTQSARSRSSAGSRYAGGIGAGGIGGVGGIGGIGLGVRGVR